MDDLTANEEGTLLEKSTGMPGFVKTAKLSIGLTNFTRGAFNLQEIIMRNNRDVLEIGVNTGNLIGDWATIGEKGSELIIGDYDKY